MSALYELITPSDCVTFESPTRQAACLVALYLGRGAYGLHDDQGLTVMHVALFGFDEAKWLAEHAPGHASIGEALDATPTADLVAALRSFAVADVSDRRAAPDVFTDLAKLAAWNEVKRTSCNDICGAAGRWADKLERQTEGA